MNRKKILVLFMCLSISAQGITAFASDMDTEYPEGGVVAEPESSEDETYIDVDEKGKAETEIIDQTEILPDLGNETDTGIQMENTDENDNDAMITTAAERSQTIALNAVTTPSQAQIESFIKSHPFNFTEMSKFEEQPVISIAAPKSGKLADSALTGGLNCLNTYRYINGISTDVALNDTYSAYAQAGTTLLAVIDNGLNHNPQQPEGMPYDFYQQGYTGTSRSNLSYGYYSMINLPSHIRGCMADLGANNVSVVGHRRWLMKSSTKEVGFGHTSDGQGTNYLATYVIDDNYTPIPEILTWPAKNTPIEMLKTTGNEMPWSIHFEERNYNMTDAVVTVTNKQTGKFATITNTGDINTGFNYDKSGYGYNHAIIFVPQNVASNVITNIENGDSYSVSVTGIKKTDSDSDTYGLDYDVNFFNVSDEVNALINPKPEGGSSGGGMSSTTEVFTNPDGSYTYVTTYNDGRVEIHTIDKNGNEIPTPDKYGQEAWDEWLENQKPKPESGGSTAITTPGKPAKPTSVVKAGKIKLKTPITKLAPKKSTTLTAAITPANTTNKNVTWSVNNTKYASISSNGKLTAKAKGAGKTVIATAKAKDGSGITASVKIKIMKGAVKSIKLSGAKTVKNGKSIKIKAKTTVTQKPANTTLTWSVNNRKYASISKSGKLTAKKAGKGKTVTITAKATDGTNKKATMKIKIK